MGGDGHGDKVLDACFQRFQEPWYPTLCESSVVTQWYPLQENDMYPFKVNETLQSPYDPNVTSRLEGTVDSSGEVREPFTVTVFILDKRVPIATSAYGQK